MKKAAEPKAKPAKVVKLKSSEAEAMVLSYLNKQNRPYNSKMIFEVEQFIDDRIFAHI
jgi:hypothetical protein